MYSGVPIRTPVWVNPGISSERAMPKSITVTLPSLSTMMFWGFKSRCTTPSECAASRASETCPMIAAAASGEYYPRSVSVVRRSCPSMYSMEMNLIPSASPRS